MSKKRDPQNAIVEKKAKKPVRAKSLPVEFNDAGEPRVVLDGPTKDRLRMTIAICLQISMGEKTTPTALDAETAVSALKLILERDGKAPTNV